MGGRNWGLTLVVLTLALVALGIIWSPRRAPADVVTFSGAVTYEGSHTGDTLYVAVVDTTGVEDVTLLALGAFPVDPPPFSQAYSVDFDNSGVGAFLMVASFLDVGGGGLDSLNGADVFGWYAGGTAPTGISSTQSRGGLDFSLPRAEIHGTITFAPGQVEAWVDVSNDPLCVLEGFRPRHYQYAPGPYAINGVYRGTYCVSAGGYVPTGPNLRICFGDPLCASPTLITLTETGVRNGVDLDFTGDLPVQRSSWGMVKSRYP